MVVLCLGATVVLLSIAGITGGSGDVEELGIYRESCDVSQPRCVRLGSHKAVLSSEGPRFPRRDENLVFYDDMTKLDGSVWGVDKTLWGDGNNAFEYYSDSPDNLYINETDGTLRLRPWLFSDLPPITTIPDQPPYEAHDVMTGDCSPWPACATFNVPDCTTTAMAFPENGDVQGAHSCQRVGGMGGAYLNPTTSASIRTKGKFSYTYGRLEIRARMPAGEWLWPAMWMLPEEGSPYGAWPQTGEIDILEMRSNSPDYKLDGEWAGRNRFGATLHYAGDNFWGAHAEAYAPNGTDWSTDYVTYGFFWAPDEMYFYYILPDGSEHRVQTVENITYGTFWSWGEAGPYKDGGPNAPFDQPFYLILNVAVGGAQYGCPTGQYWGHHPVWCTGYPNSAPPPTEFWKRKDEWLPQWKSADEDDRLGMSIDWIKLWQ